MISQSVMFHDNGEVFCCLLEFAATFSPKPQPFIIHILPLLCHETTVQSQDKMFIQKKLFSATRKNPKRFQFRNSKRQTNCYECDIKSTRAENLCEYANKRKFIQRISRLFMGRRRRDVSRPKVLKSPISVCTKLLRNLRRLLSSKHGKRRLQNPSLDFWTSRFRNRDWIIYKSCRSNFCSWFHCEFLIMK